jgi:hypothetical protein
MPTMGKNVVVVADVLGCPVGGNGLFIGQSLQITVAKRWLVDGHNKTLLLLSILAFCKFNWLY